MNASTSERSNSVVEGGVSGTTKREGNNGWAARCSSLLPDVVETADTVEHEDVRTD